MKINYLEEDFPISYQYDDYNEHTIRISQNVNKIGVRTNIGGYDDQITYFNSGKIITEILPSCFINCKSLKDVILQDNVNVINNEAFKNCEQLSSFDNDTFILPRKIGDEVFSNCNLEKLIYN